MLGKERDSSTINNLLKKYPDTLVITIQELMSKEEFQKQKQKQEEYPIEGGTIGIITTHDDKIVLTRRTGPHSGWALPGGRVEMGELFDHALTREVAEECGINIKIFYPFVVEQKTFISPESEHLPFLLVTFVGVSISEYLPYQTEEAKKEGLEIGVFPLNTLPEEMLLLDKQKITNFFSL